MADLHLDPAADVQTWTVLARGDVVVTGPLRGRTVGDVQGELTYLSALEVLATGVDNRLREARRAVRPARLGFRQALEVTFTLRRA
ncbi:hypothetical protein [Deinococcus kurensis]|uniref:hypothetical protein n=1 Tax=Deinococcus kurensis TaxID=2662757 RepID=UPI0012D30634|nr:hypothetical protein [Deinococcus kurensis]